MNSSLDETAFPRRKRYPSSRSWYASVKTRESQPSAHGRRLLSHSRASLGFGKSIKTVPVRMDTASLCETASNEDWAAQMISTQTWNGLPSSSCPHQTLFGGILAMPRRSRGIWKTVKDLAKANRHTLACIQQVVKAGLPCIECLQAWETAERSAGW